jgi:SAM-dependent methyltransferase
VAIGDFRGVKAIVRGAVRSSGLFGYQPEHWSTADWARAYGSGQLDYFRELDDLGRYSLVAGYVRFFGSSRILDVGCGPGLLRLFLDDRALTRYVGVDLSAEAIDRAQQHADARTEFRRGDVMVMDLPKVELVVLNEVLYFAPDPTAMLDRVAALLADDGILVTSMWRHPADRLLWRLIDDRFHPLDKVWIRNEASKLARRGWSVACHRRIS